MLNYVIIITKDALVLVHMIMLKIVYLVFLNINMIIYIMQIEPKKIQIIVFQKIIIMIKKQTNYLNVSQQIIFII